MESLLEGVKLFHERYYAEQRELFEKLSESQEPKALFITCSDSRIDPGLLTQTRPGELFVLRNAGNIVPPYGAVAGGESATIEYAVSALNIRDVIVCGHSNCGAMKAVLERESVKDLPAVAAWLEHALDVHRTADADYREADEAARLDRLIERNVLAQFENLRTHPAVESALRQGQLRLHGWVYRIKQGDVAVYSEGRSSFVSALNDAMLTTKTEQRVSPAVVN